MKRLMLVVLVIALTGISFAQNLEIRGKIVSDKGESLPGVSIQVKNTTTGTVSDVNGYFSVEAPPDATLIFSFIGYESQEIDVNGNTSIDVVMKEQLMSVDEVVVTAMGISQAKKSLGYSTQNVNSETLTKVNTINLGNLLTGQVAGLTVDNPTGLFQAPEFSLRNKTPLVVIDGIPVETDFYNVSATDIEEITVLKGTSASALYGSRGRNGAILLMTKNAKKEGLIVHLNHRSMITAGYTVFPKTQTDYGNGSNGLYEFWDGKDGGISDGDMIWGPKFEPGVEIAQWNSPIYDNVTGETIEWYGDVSGTQYDDKSRYSRVPIPWEYHNNLKEFLQTGYVTTTDLAIENKREKASTRFAINYTKQKGQVPNSKLQTGGLSFTNSYRITKNLLFDSKISYNKVYSPNYPRHGYGPKNHMYTLLIWMGDDVNGKVLATHYYVPGQEGYRQANFNYAWYNNVYFAAYELNQEFDEDVINGQLKLKWDITKDLSIQGRTSAVVDKTFEDRESPKSYLNYEDPREGDYKTWNKNLVYMDNDVLATYNKQLTSALNLTVNAGTSTYNRRYREEYNATDGLIVPWVYSLNNSAGNVKATTEVEEKAIRSIYGMVNFDMLDALYLTFTARNDWSSTLPESNNSYFYPSVSLSTLISNLVDLPDVFNFMKVYGSWAQVSSDLSPYQILPTYYNAGSYGGLTRISYPSTVVGDDDEDAIIVNPDIEPEKSTSFEVGLATTILDNRINLDVTYYTVVDENQILNLDISEASGFDGRKVNGNEYTTTGFELMLNAVPVRRSDIQWQLNLNMSHMVKKLTGIYGGEDKYGNYSLNERVDNYYATGWMKSSDGRVILSEETGLPIKDPFPQMFGHTEPDVRFGLQNSIQYKKFRFDVDFDGAIGGIMRSLTVEKMWWGGKHPESTTYRDEQYASEDPIYVADGVNVVSGELTTDVDGNVISDTRAFQENTTAVNWQTWCQNYPYRAKVSTDENETFANIFDRSFVKLRRVSIAFDATELLNINSLKRIELSAYGYNLLILKKAKIVDPDFGHDNDLQDPSARYLGLGINVTF